MKMRLIRIPILSTKCDTINNAQPLHDLYITNMNLCLRNERLVHQANMVFCVWLELSH